MRSEGKMIFVTGGVMSSIGKGIATASLGRALTSRGYRVNALKIDPYVNVDAGTMNPFQHGEVFVTNDGAETDLDLGNYERFLGVDCRQYSNFTSGAVYQAVIEKERAGEYLGETVQLIPHITNEIKERIYYALSETRSDILIVEIGGTIGDFETPPFVEAIREIRIERGVENTLFMHVIPIAQASPWGEMKTKPTQHSVRALLALGIQPDVLICRTSVDLSKEIRRKIASTCGVPVEAVIEASDVEEIEEAPLLFEREGVGDLVVQRMRLPKREQVECGKWEAMTHRLKNPKRAVEIAVVGKYTEHGDAYLSVKEALKHGGIANEARVQIRWIESDELTEADNLSSRFEGVGGMLVPGGYGYRGIEGMISAIRYARENRLPYLGLCLGLQCMVIERARSAGLAGANSAEFDENAPHPVIHLMDTQDREGDKGGTQRLGLYPCVLKPDTRAHAAYGETRVEERHRHRYEVNNAYRERLEEAGLVWSGLSPDGSLVEIAEASDHPWMVGSQFHPEFRSRPLAPHPLFVKFIEASLEWMTIAP